jgi:thiamine-monophosphate kinase
MKLKDVGEFELIELMARSFRRDAAEFRGGIGSRGLTLGIGDDAAIWSSPASGFTIATADAMIEGTHFTTATTSWYDLGWKAMSSNISDIAGMGGIPLYALAVLGTAGSQRVDDILQLCKGMDDAARLFGVSVVGGDTVSSPLTMISITLIGETLGGRDAEGSLPVLSRSSARAGDSIAVTGRLGSSAGGLELLLRDPLAVPERYLPLLDAHRHPLPRVREGQLLVQAGVRCGMDLSDGLAGDLMRICKASGVAARVQPERLPMDPLLVEAFGKDAARLALSGGEDYELLCVGPSDVVDGARKILADHGTTLTVVGRIVEATEGAAPLMLVGADGSLSPLGTSGWEHFVANGGTGDGAARD